MLKSTSLAVAAAGLTIGLLMAGGANAADSDPNNGPNDACMTSAYDLADEAEKKNLPDTKLEKLDGMFNAMEKHCKALELPQAQAVAGQIKAVIDGSN